VYTKKQKEHALKIFFGTAGAGGRSHTKTANYLRLMTPSEFQHVTNTNVRSWVDAAAKGTLGGSRQRDCRVSQPCLAAMRQAAEAAIASGHCVGSRMLYQIFLTVLEQYGEVSACQAINKQWAT
jgi:hypothetical protein